MAGTSMNECQGVGRCTWTLLEAFEHLYQHFSRIGQTWVSIDSVIVIGIIWSSLSLRFKAKGMKSGFWT
jgi:hypothetical protein